MFNIPGKSDAHGSKAESFFCWEESSQSYHLQGGRFGVAITPTFAHHSEFGRHYATFIMIIGSKSSRIHPSSVPSYLPTVVGKSVHRSHHFVDPQKHRLQIAKLVNKNRINYSN